MNISVIPVDTPDGLNRKFEISIGNVITKGVSCPIIGNICMDSFMVDTSNVDCKEGDEVVIFGPKNTILSLKKIELFLMRYIQL